MCNYTRLVAATWAFPTAGRSATGFIAVSTSVKPTRSAAVKPAIAESGPGRAVFESALRTGSAKAWSITETRSIATVRAALRPEVATWLKAATFGWSRSRRRRGPGSLFAALRGSELSRALTRPRRGCHFADASLKLVETRYNVAEVLGRRSANRSGKQLFGQLFWLDAFTLCTAAEPTTQLGGQANRD